jgi:hypothetical protein
LSELLSITIDCASEIASIAIIGTVKIFPSLSTTRSDQFLGCSSELSRARQKGATRDVVTAAATTTTEKPLNLPPLSTKIRKKKNQNAQEEQYSRLRKPLN